MQEQQYVSNQGIQNDQHPILRFLLGLFTGAAIATPVTALVVKKVCEKDKIAAVATASEMAENRGIEAATKEAKEWIENNLGRAERALFEASRGIPEGVSNGYSQEGQNEAKSVLPEEHKVAIEQAFFVEEKVSGNAGVQRNRRQAEAYLASIQSPPDDIPADVDINSFDVQIDDEEATQEASEFSESHVKYLDMVERYRDSGGKIPPMTISREQFENEHIFEKCFVNWYEVDDVFEENNTCIDDPGYLFGFTSGRDMFKPSLTALREDPDICHIRNARISTDFEITRVHGSYEKLVVDGEVYYNGEANPQY